MAPDSTRTPLESWLTSLILLCRHYQKQTSDYKSEYSSLGSGLPTKTEQMTPQGMVLLKLQWAATHWASLPQPIPSFSALVFYLPRKAGFCIFHKGSALGETKLRQSKQFMRHVCILFSYAPGRRRLRSQFFLSVLTKDYIFTWF